MLLVVAAGGRERAVEITFNRPSEYRVFSSVVRDDGVTVRVPGYGHVEPLPHDFAHFVVERELELRQGFWASVVAGAIFPGMAVVGGRQRPHATDRSAAVLKANGPFVGRSEVLVGVLMPIVEQGLDARPAIALKQLAEAQSVFPKGPLSLTEAELARVCTALQQAMAQWKAAGVGGQVAVTWELRSRVRPLRAIHDRRRGRYIGERRAAGTGTRASRSW